MPEPSRSMCVYPWDLLHEGVEPALRTIHGLQCSHVAVNCSYHSGRFFHPRWTSGLMNHRRGAGVSFVPNPGLYVGTVAPAVDEEVARTGVHREAREWSERLGLQYDVWLVGTHNSTLGARHPELTVENAVGDRFRYALCPGHPAVRQYLRALVTDVCQQLRPHQIALESPNFLGFFHDDHHELILASLGEPTLQLLSLCFCPHCCERATAAGVDSAAARVQVRALVAQLVEGERGSLDPAFANMEMAALLAEFPDLYAYLRVRIGAVISLLAELRQAAHANGARVSVVPSIFTRPASKAWLEGTSLRQLPEVSDSIFLLAYFLGLPEIRADIQWVRLLAPGHPFVVGFNAGHPHTPDPAVLAENARTAVRAGAAGVTYYNYGLLTRTRLDWVRQANAAALAAALS